MDILISLLPLFLIISFGSLTMHFRILPNDIFKYLNKYIVFVAAPSMTLVGLLDLNTAQISQYPKFILINAITAILFSLIVFWLVRKISKNYENFAALYYTSIDGNTIYFGIPIISTFVEAENIFYIFIYFATVTEIIGFVNAYLLARGQSQKPTIIGSIKDMAHNPVVIAALIGIVSYIFIQLYTLYIIPLLPSSLNDAIAKIAEKSYFALEMIGDTTSTVALFSLGTFLYFNYRIHNYSFALISTIFKIIIYPIFVYIVVYILFPLDPISAQISVLLAAMPSALYCVVASDIYNFNKSQTINTIVISSILFLLIFPYLVEFLGIKK